jgi:hypothetical protein
LPAFEGTEADVARIAAVAHIFGHRVRDVEGVAEVLKDLAERACAADFAEVAKFREALEQRAQESEGKDSVLASDAAEALEPIQNRCWPENIAEIVARAADGPGEVSPSSARHWSSVPRRAKARTKKRVKARTVF